MAFLTPKFPCVDIINSNLHDVQRDVFEHFSDLRASAQSALDILSEDEEDSTQNICICSLTNTFDVTPHDIKTFKDLLLKISSGVSSPQSAREKKNQLNRLKVLHKKVLNAQILVMNKLLAAHPCVHNTLPAKCEKHVVDLLSRQQLYQQKIPSFYRIFLSVVAVSTSQVPLYFTEFTVRNRYLVNTPPLLGFNIQHQPLYPPKQVSLLRNIVTSKIFRTKKIAILTERILSLLFSWNLNKDIYIPFYVKYGVSESDLSVNITQLEFGDPIHSYPLNPRERARLFYEYSFLSNCCTPMHGLPRETKSHSVPESSAKSGSPMLLKSKLHNSDQSSTNLKTGNNYNSQDKNISQTFIVNDQSPGRVSVCHNLRSRASKCQTTKSRSPTPEDLEDSHLLIDLNSPVDNKLKDKSTQSETRQNECGDVTRKRIVANRCDRRQHASIFNSRGDSPLISSTPASPNPQTPACPHSSAYTSGISPCVIPLEPINLSGLSQREASDFSMTIKDEFQSFQSSSTEFTRDAKSVTATSSLSLLEFGDVQLLVHFLDTCWSPTRSCLACSTHDSNVSSSVSDPTLSKKIHCALWPSCQSRALTVNQSTETDYPIVIQVKAEYLNDWGCESLDSDEVTNAWIGSVIRNKADILRVRVQANTGQVVWAEYQTLDALLQSSPDLQSNSKSGLVSSLFEGLFKLSPGHYLLTQQPGRLNCYQVYRSFENSGLTNMNNSQSDCINLENLKESFIRSSKQLIDVAHLIQNSSNEQQITGILNFPLHSVRRLKLDLNIPAGLDLDVSNDTSSGLGLKLPGLPMQRLGCTSNPTNVFDHISTICESNTLSANGNSRKAKRKQYAVKQTKFRNTKKKFH